MALKFNVENIIQNVPFISSSTDRNNIYKTPNLILSLEMVKKNILCYHFYMSRLIVKSYTAVKIFRFSILLFPYRII